MKELILPTPTSTMPDYRDKAAGKADSVLQPVPAGSTGYIVPEPLRP